MKYTTSKAKTTFTQRFSCCSIKGFTLIEILIVVAIVSILAAIAIPSYFSQIAKGRRAEARAALMNAMQQEERYYTQNNTYLPFTYGAATVGFTTWSGDQGNLGAKYNLKAEACVAGTNANTTGAINICVALTALPVNGWVDPEISTLILSSDGTKQCTGTQSSNKLICWP